MKKVTLTTVVLASLFVLSSCQKDESSIVDEQQVSIDDNLQEPELEITAKVIEKLENNSYDTRDIEVVEFESPDGTMEQSYLIEGDIMITAEEIEELPEIQKGSETERHYRVENLVSPLPRNIEVLGWTETTRGKELNTNEKRALQLAVLNYNNLSLNIRFRLRFGGGSQNYDSSDIVVFHEPDLDIGAGRAEYPRGNGDPGKRVRLNASGNTLHLDAIEHVITHELGHAIGLRHIDWDTKVSCSDARSSDSRSLGVIPIPGTIDGHDATSIMVSCYNPRITDGEFSDDDKRALRYIY